MAGIQKFLGGTIFEVPDRYSCLEPIGSGAYGVVCSARDSVSCEAVAIKKIVNVFEHITFAKRTLRELRILRNLRHENLVDIRRIILPGSRETFKDVYVVSELMESDLAVILKSSQELTNEHCRYFLYQILRGLKFMHFSGVIHRDCKPRNILVNSNCDLKICDYGLSRVQQDPDSGGSSEMTEYVCTRWYRAPEVLCSWADYDAAVDVWSVGCIFAEMFRRRPLFPGANTQNQLRLIINLVGVPSPADVRRIPNAKCRKFINSLSTKPSKGIREIVPGLCDNALEVLNSTLCFSPDTRLDVEAVLGLPYLQPLHDPEDEPTRGPLDPSDFEFERRKVDLWALREEIFMEALRYYPRQRQEYLEEQRQIGKAYNIQNYRLMMMGESHYETDED